MVVVIQLKDLQVTQAGLRYPQQLGLMVSFVRAGGVFNNDVISRWLSRSNPKLRPSLIQVSKFPDGALYLHDGHHRGVSIILGGREFIHKEEYEITDWTYEEYEEINFQKNWVTPFDPRKEVRLPEFFNFKDKVYELYNSSAKAARKFIENNRSEYLLDRLDHHNLFDIFDGELVKSL